MLLSPQPRERGGEGEGGGREVGRREGKWIKTAEHHGMAILQDAFAKNPASPVDGLKIPLWISFS